MTTGQAVFNDPANPHPQAWAQTYGTNKVDPEKSKAPKIKVLCKRTMLFIEPLGTASRHMQVEAKPGIQLVDDWIQNTEGWKHGSQDGSIILVHGRSTLEPQLAPPTVAQVVAQRNCTTEEAETIVALEQVKFDQGEYPYPAKGSAPEPAPAAPAQSYAQPPTLEAVKAAGFTDEAAANRIVERETAKAAAGVFPYGPNSDPALWGEMLPDQAEQASDSGTLGKKNGKKSN